MNKRGFTLIELMIAVVITSIVVMAAYILMNAVTSNFNTEDDRVALRSNLRNAEMLIQRDLGRIGYRSVIYNSGSGFSVLANNGNSNVTFQAFQHSTWNQSSDTTMFSQFTIVGDITDYGHFEIERLMGATVTVRPTTLSSIQTNDCLSKISATKNSASTLTCGVGYCNNCQDGALEVNGADRFNDAFVSSFKNAAAVRFEPNSNAMTSDIRLLSKTPINGYNLNLSEAANLPGDHNYAALNIGDRVTPISAITYPVMENETGGHDLVRCLHDLNEMSSAHKATVKSCAIVLRNVLDFRIYPFAASQDFNDQVTNTVNTSAVSDAQWNLNVNQISSFMFHLSARSSTPLSNPDSIFDAEANELSYMPPFEKIGDLVYNREHVLGSALIYSRPEKGSTSSNSIYNATALTLSSAAP